MKVWKFRSAGGLYTKGDVKAYAQVTCGRFREIPSSGRLRVIHHGVTQPLPKEEVQIGARFLVRTGDMRHDEPGTVLCYTIHRVWCRMVGGERLAAYNYPDLEPKMQGDPVYRLAMTNRYYRIRLDSGQVLEWGKATDLWPLKNKM